MIFFENFLSKAETNDFNYKDFENTKKNKKCFSLKSVYTIWKVWPVRQKERNKFCPEPEDKNVLHFNDIFQFFQTSSELII